MTREKTLSGNEARPNAGVRSSLWHFQRLIMASLLVGIMVKKTPLHICATLRINFPTSVQTDCTIQTMKLIEVKEPTKLLGIARRKIP